MSIATTLRQAAKLQEKIEALREQFAVLIEKARAELAASPAQEIPMATRQGTRPKMLSGRKKPVPAPRPPRRSPLAGFKRAASPTGPLPPAVVKVLRSKGRPMNVQDIFSGLMANGYQFNSSEPKKNLAARIYRLSGVKQVGPGLFGPG